jgi:hypothetical protein
MNKTILFSALHEKKAQNTIRITHAYAHLLVDMHLAAFAPAFTFSLCESEYSRKPPNAHSAEPLGGIVKKKKRQTI